MFPPRKRTMAATCFGQDPVASELATSADPSVDSDASLATLLAAAEAPGADRPGAGRQAPAEGSIEEAHDSSAAPSAGPPSDAPSQSSTQNPTQNPTQNAEDQPQLALEQMTLAIEDGLLMVFGPEGDPVPPGVFAETAALRPEALLSLPDGVTAPAARIATVLDAQTRGRLGAADQSADQGAEWLLTMLRGGGGPEDASEDVLRMERGSDAGHETEAGDKTEAEDVVAAEHDPATADQPVAFAAAGADPGDHLAVDSSHCPEVDQASLDQALDHTVDAPLDFDLEEPAAITDLEGRSAIADTAHDLDLEGQSAIGHAPLDFGPEGPGAIGDVPDQPDLGAPLDLDPAADRLECELGDMPPLDEPPLDEPEDARHDGFQPAIADADSGPSDRTAPDEPTGSALSAPMEPADPSDGISATSGRDAARAGAGDVQGGAPVGSSPPDDGPGGHLAGHAVEQRVAVDLANRVPEQGTGSAATAAGQADAEQPDIDPERMVLVVIRGVPEHGQLSTGVRNDDGSWSISPLDLPSVTISLASTRSVAPAGEVGSEREGAGDLDITGIALSEEGALAAISETVPLADYLGSPASGNPADVQAAEAHPPEAPVDMRDGAASSADPAIVPEPRMIPLEVDPGVWAGERFDALVIRDLPAGAKLSAGTHDPAIDAWVLMPQDLRALAILAPAELRAEVTLTLMGVALRPGDARAARVLARLPVTLT